MAAKQSSVNNYFKDAIDMLQINKPKLCEALKGLKNFVSRVRSMNLMRPVKLIGFEFLFCMSASVLVFMTLDIPISWRTVLIWTLIFSFIKIVLLEGPKIEKD